MKKSILTVLFALCSTIGFAQVSFQVKAGLNLSSYIGENSDHSKFKPGARIGVGMEYQFTDLISSHKKGLNTLAAMKEPSLMPMQT